MNKNSRFDFSAAKTTWLDQDVYLTHLFNAPSLVFPYVESFVNTAVDNLEIEDGLLRQQCQQFIDEESSHAKEHVKYNQVLHESGYDFVSVRNAIRKKLQMVKTSWSPLSRLAVAVGFEHLTLNISKVVLQNNLLSAAENNMKSFWLWHMKEEIGHKDVLMDLYLYLGGGYWRRVFIFTLVWLHYGYYGTKIYLRLIKIDGGSKLKGLCYLFGKQSFFIRSLIYGLRCYRFRYHPREEKLPQV